MTVGRVDGFRVTKVWDENQPTAELFASVFDGRPAVCDSFDQVSDDVDLVFIADCNFDGADHVELAKPGLQKGVATFVDKPFGGTFSNGNMLVELAKKYSAPIHTDSIMTAMPATEQFITRLAEIGGADYLAIEGSGDATAGLIHSISLAQHIFGPDVVDVRALVGKTQKYILLDYHGESVKNGVGITCGVGGPYSGMYAHAFSEHGCVEAVFNDFKYTFGAKHIVEQIRDMVRSGETSRPHIDAMLAALRTLDTVHRALQCAP
jgi:predicted dehydrogenase